MYFLTHLFRVCYFSVFVKLLSGYLLFAANFEDFHTIAKKLGAENFSDSLKRNPTTKDSYEDDYVRSYEIQQKSHKFTKKQQTTIDFEELVERVKKRIEKELKEKYLNKKDKIIIDNVKEKGRNKYDYNSKEKYTINKENVDEMSTIEYDTEYVEGITDIPPKSFSNKTKNQEERLEYADATFEMTPSDKKRNKKNIYTEKDSPITHRYTTPTEKIDMPYEKVHMSKKDSYEDYKIPEKEANIYSSTEAKPMYETDNKRLKKGKNNQKKINEDDSKKREIINTKRIKNKKSRTKKTTPNSDYIEKAIDSEENDEQYGNSNNFDEIESKVTKRAKSVTNIPTRERYKTVTPNYNAKLPVLVEKYDFEEPIPEKDREREILKYYGNPPARINKKIRLI